ncbi:phage tail tape measure protein [Fusobacterium ulcerans]|uniref:phage tail tape measure protein n=1 Tax=Fusobacterium ulcerans TaxID=861 RepID=UPI0030A3F02B
MSNYILSAALELKDNFSSKINSASKSFKSFSSQVADGGKVIGGSLKGIGNQLGVTAERFKKGFNTVERYGKVAGAAVTAFTGKSYLGWVELEDQLLRNAAISGATAKEQEKLNKQVIVQGRETRFTAKQVAEAQMYQAQSGKTVNEILEITPTLLKMSIASGDDLATTSDYLTNSMTAAGISIKDTTRYADLLANMSMRTNMSMSDMAETILKIGTLTKGQEKIEDIATMMGVLADNGIRSAEAGTAMKSIYARLFKAQDDKKMQKLFKKYDLNLYKEVIGADGEKHIEWKGLLEIIEDMKPAFQKMDAAEKNYFLTTVAGAHHMDAFSALLKANNEQLEKSRNAANNAEGSLDKFYKTMTKGSKQTVEEFKSAIDGFGKALGKGLAPIIDEKLKEMTKAINGVTEQQLSTKNINAFLDEIEEKAKIVMGTYVALKGAIFAVSHPYLTAAMTGWGTGVYLGNKLGSALEPYVNSPKMIEWRDKRAKEREANLGLSTSQLAESFFKRKQNSVSEFGGYLTTNGFVSGGNNITQNPSVFNQGTAGVNITGVSIQIGDKNINRDELVKEIGEKMVKQIEEAQMTQQ